MWAGQGSRKKARKLEQRAFLKNYEMMNQVEARLCLGRDDEERKRGEGSAELKESEEVYCRAQLAHEWLPHQAKESSFIKKDKEESLKAWSREHSEVRCTL